ncbi:hypothetical protein Bca4012_043807 [Brassica carinata]
MIRPRGVTLITANQFIPDSLIRGYGRKLTWSACEAKMKGSNLLYLRPPLTSTTRICSTNTSIDDGSNHSHLKRTHLASISRNSTSIISVKIP